MAVLIQVVGHHNWLPFQAHSIQAAPLDLGLWHSSQQCATLAPGATLKRSWPQRTVGHLREMAKQGPAYALQKLSQKLRQKLCHDPAVPTLSKEDLRPQFRRQIGRTYIPQPYSGKVVLFRAIDRNPFESVAVNPQFGWNTWVQKGVETYDVPGDHLGILKDPNVRVLTQALKTFIDQSIGQAAP